MMSLEERLNALTEEWTKSQAFLKPASWGIEQAVQVKGLVREHVSSFVKLWGISHQSELEAVHQRIDELERALERSIESEAKLAERLTHLEAQIETLELERTRHSQKTASNKLKAKSKTKP